MGADHLKGKPLILDRIGADLPGKLVKLVADDMERARLEREERDKKKRAKKGPTGG